jgi:hypothetical protein
VALPLLDSDAPRHPDDFLLGRSPLAMNRMGKMASVLAMALPLACSLVLAVDLASACRPWRIAAPPLILTRNTTA